MIRALNPLFPGFPFRLLSAGAETHRLQGSATRPDRARAAGDSTAKWNAPDHWIEDDRQF